MAIERTLSIIKPDAVAKNVIGQIYARFEAAGLKIIAASMAHLSRGEAEQFYAVHKERPFFKDLVEFMISGPVMIQVLEGENAILKNRDLMGATDPKKAAPGTIRADFADSIDANAVHGSDAAETAKVEVALLLPRHERLLPLEPASVPPMTMTANLLDFDLEGLAAFCEALGEKRFRATQLFRWIHQRGARDFDQMSDLAKSLREKLKTSARDRGACRSSRSTNPPTAPSSGCSTWATAMPSRPCSSPKTTAARCACPRRPAAPSAAASAPPGTRAFRAT